MTCLHETSHLTSMYISAYSCIMLDKRLVRDLHLADSTHMHMWDLCARLISEGLKLVREADSTALDNPHT
jgi:hypothetical protein